MSKLVTLLAAITIALTISTPTDPSEARTAPQSSVRGTADARRNEDATVRMHDGTVIQREYKQFYQRHKHDPRLVVFEDGSPALISCNAGIIIGPDYKARRFTC